MPTSVSSSACRRHESRDHSAFRSIVASTPPAPNEGARSNRRDENPAPITPAEFRSATEELSRDRRSAQVSCGSKRSTSDASRLRARLPSGAMEARGGPELLEQRAGSGGFGARTFEPGDGLRARTWPFGARDEALALQTIELRKVDALTRVGRRGEGSIQDVVRRPGSSPARYAAARRELMNVVAKRHPLPEYSSKASRIRLRPDSTRPSSTSHHPSKIVAVRR